ncbi:MAG: sugar phosphate isomerase/epimerase [bacterium]
MLKLSLCSYSFHRTLEAKKMTIEEIMKYCAETLKVGGFEILGEYIPSTEKKDLMALKKLATELHLTICAISAPFNSFAQENEEGLNEQIKMVNKYLDVAYELGTPVLKLFAAWGDPKDKERLWPNVVKGLQACAAHAEELGITLTVEPHNHGAYPSTAEDTIKLLKDVNSPYVKLLLDIGNYTDKDIYDSIEKTVPYADYMHAKFHKMSDDAKTADFDYDRIFKILKAANYRGFMSIEYEGDSDELKYIPLCVDFMKRYIAEYTQK